jgi:hypothetical protein
MALLARKGGWHFDMDVRPNLRATLDSILLLTNDNNNSNNNQSNTRPQSSSPQSTLKDTYAAIDGQPANQAVAGADARMIVFEEAVLSPADAARAANSYAARRGAPEECQRIANYAMGAGVGHALLLMVLEELQRRVLTDPNPLTDYDVLYTTGPALLTTTTYAFLAAPDSVDGNTGAEVSETVVAAAARASKSCALASGLPPRDSLLIVRRFDDQHFFSHLASGSWRNSADRLKQGF